ncbi:hypothetical protein C0Q70_19068 [Pomacea canaliculata]|uniref:Uncharacterized protein n=1 Tax=Pomacea canaliculata TaxID=400727 RepID=A0A2T7NIC4_POMCA|nr:hypothetical protein C0Q70_19068 [Pomacea canaliculata]
MHDLSDGVFVILTRVRFPVPAIIPSLHSAVVAMTALACPSFRSTFVYSSLCLDHSLFLTGLKWL